MIIPLLTFKLSPRILPLTEILSPVKYVISPLTVSNVWIVATPVVLKSVLPVSVASNSYYEPNVLTINTFVDREIIESIRNKILDIDVDNPLSFQTEIVSA